MRRRSWRRWPPESRWDSGPTARPPTTTWTSSTRWTPAAKLHKYARADPTALPAETVFRMATMGGARVLNLHDRIGSLEPGKRADIVLLDTRRAGLTPLYDVYSLLVYQARGSDVSTVLVNGRVVVRDREVLMVNEAEVVERARDFRDRVLEVMDSVAAEVDSGGE